MCLLGLTIGDRSLVVKELHRTGYRFNPDSTVLQLNISGNSVFRTKASTKRMPPTIVHERARECHS